MTRGWTIPLLLVLALAGPAFGGWADNAWPFRRGLEVDWAGDRPAIEDLATADFYTGGHHQPSGENIRVATEEGKYVASHVLMIGPGDRMRIVFAPLRGVRRYYVYFGHPKAPPPPRGTEDVVYHCGILLNMHKLTGTMGTDFKEVEAAWERSREPIGQMVVSHPQAGFNPFDDQSSIISRYSGSLIVLEEGKYSFAISAGDRAAFYVDGKPVLMALGQTGNARFNAGIELKRGRHDVVLYQLSRSGDMRMNVVWKRPGAVNYEQIPGEAFGVPLRATVGAMEQVGKQFIADFKIEYVGEAFFADHYAHHYKFTAQPGKMPPGAQVKYEWDLGDGQMGVGTAADHVYLTDGEYAVKLSIRAGLQSDVQTNRISVSRLYERIDAPPEDALVNLAKIVAEYDVAAMPVRWLAWATLMQQRAKMAGPLEKVAMRLATVREGVDAGFGANTLVAAADELSREGHFDAAARILEAVPADSVFQPTVGKRFGQILLWRVGDFGKAAKVLEELGRLFPNDGALRRAQGQALVLNQNAAAGRKILESIASDAPEDRRAALIGALARTIEYHITEGDWESGEQAWEKWQLQYPADFLEGYSVVLQTRLMELAGAQQGAAKAAEAFALAAPKSSYAPQLLDRASKLLAKTDLVKSGALRNLLRQKYPEDPLSQDGRSGQ